MKKMIAIIYTVVFFGLISPMCHAMQWNDIDIISTNDSNNQDYTVATNQHFEYFCYSLVKETPLKSLELLARKVDSKFNLSKEIQTSFFDIGNDTVFNRRLVRQISQKSMDQDKRLAIQTEWFKNLQSISNITFFRSNIRYNISKNIKIYHIFEIENQNATFNFDHQFSLFMYKNNYNGTFFCDIDLITLERVRFGFVKSF
jgi:hypothetical protein